MHVLAPTVTALAMRAPAPAMRSAAWIPGGESPSYLDGSLAGDVGFDPLCLTALARTDLSIDSSSWTEMSRQNVMVMATPYEVRRKVAWMREAELKHARLAMLAAAGWPISELLDGPLSKLTGQPYLLEATNGRAPSPLVGHLFDGPQGGFLALVILGTAYLEANTLDNAEGLTPSGYVPGDLGFDPISLRSEKMELAEIKHGRLAMLAVTGYAVQEAIFGRPIVEQSAAFFHPPAVTFPSFF